jgi:hypothetical protein
MNFSLWGAFDTFIHRALTELKFVCHSREMP